MNPTILGLILTALGLGLALLALLALRVTPQLRPSATPPPTPPNSPHIQSHTEAVLLVQVGGRVAYLNPLARELFNVWEDEPNLENLARKARPSEAFMLLCSTEGRAGFTLNGKFVEGTSYYAPGSIGSGQEFSSAMLVSLRRPKIVLDTPLPAAGGPGERAAYDEQSKSLSTFTELSQAMSASLDLEQTLFVILQSCRRLLPSDYLEITLWDEENQRLLPYRMVGLPGVDQHLEKAPEGYESTQGYSGLLVTKQQALRINDVNSFQGPRPALDRQRFPFQSYLGVPLVIAGELLGTLELASLSAQNYTEGDLQLLQLLAGQASVALKNALLFQEQLARSEELAGLANLARTVTAVRDASDMYSRLIESIAPLLNVDILGFMIYDELTRSLEGQMPFKGIHPDLMSYCQTTIQPDSEAERVWQSGDAVIANHATEDERINALELHAIAMASAMRQAVLMPLTTSRRTLGYLLAANKHDGAPFDQNDLRFISIVAGQAAPIIENANLVQESRRRAQRAETLRRVASLTSSSATLEEIIKYSLSDLGRLLQADMAIIFLIDETHGELRLHRPSLFGVGPELAVRLGRIAIDDPQFSLTVTGSRQQWVSSNVTESAPLPDIYHRIVQERGICSVINVPLMARERALGEMMLASNLPGFFSYGDAQTIATAAGQLAAAIERAGLYSQTDQGLRRRVDELTALARIGRELNTTLKLDDLLQRVFDEALRVTRADCGAIMLFDTEKLYAVRSGWIPDDGRIPILINLGHALSENLHPLEQWVLEQGEAVVIDDFTALEAARPKAQEGESPTAPPDGDAAALAIAAIPNLKPAHSGIRSAMVIPIAYQGQVAGLIHLHARQAQHFTQAEREITEALAVQAAIALGNTQRFSEQKQRTEELNRRVEALSKIFEVSQVLQSEQPIDQALEAIAYAVQGSTPFETVLISVYHAEKNQLERVAGAGIPLPSFAELRAHPAPFDSMMEMLRPEFKLGRVYFIPSGVQSIPTDIRSYRPQARDDGGIPEDSPNAWKPADILMAPLFSANGEPLGMLSVDAPRDNRRPDHTTLETLEIFSGQAALVIENQLKVSELRFRLQRTNQDLNMAQQAARQAQQHLPVLLHKDLERTITIQNLSRRAHRIQAGLDISQVVSKQPNRQDLLQTLAAETMMRMGVDVVLLAESTSSGLNLIAALGNIPAEVNPKALLGQRNPLRHSLLNNELLLVSDLSSDNDWQGTPLLRALEARRFFSLPVLDALPAGRNGKTASKPSAALLGIGQSYAPPFTPEDRQLFELLGRQVAIALQNLRIVEDTQRRLNEVNLLLDFSRQLGGLEPAGILRTLMENALRAVPNANLAMVMLYDPRQNVLIPQMASGYTKMDELLSMVYRPGEGLAGQVFEQCSAINIDEVQFTRHYNLSPENLLHYRNVTAGRLPVSSLAAPIIAGTSLRGSTQDTQISQARALPLGVIVLDNTQNTHAFTSNDLAVITSLAQQTTLTLENARLYQASRRRSTQLQALSKVGATITANLRSEALIDTLLDQLKDILPYDTGTLWLRQKNDDAPINQATHSRRMVIRSARGFTDSDERVGLAVDMEDSVLLNEMAQTGRPIWVSDVRKDERFRALSMADVSDGEEDNLGYEFLSWLGVPLIASGVVIGVIALEKAEPGFYSSDDIQVGANYAAQAASGLVNADLYEESVRRTGELDQRSQTLGILNRLSIELSGSLDANRILDYAVQEFMQLMNCSAASALTVEPIDGSRRGSGKSGPLAGSTQMVLRAEYPYASNNSPFLPGAVIPNAPIFERLRQTQGIFNTENVAEEPELAPLQPFLHYHQSRSLLIVPVVNPGSDRAQDPQLLGMLVAHGNENDRFGPDEVELARTMSNQVSIALQNAHLLAETLSLTEDLEQRVAERTVELGRERQRAETLLRIISELSASLDLDQVLNRTLQVLSEYVDAAQITILIARPGERKLNRLASIGYTPGPTNEGSTTPLDLDEGLAGWIISQRQSAMIPDLLIDERWISLPYADGEDRPPFQHRSALGVPLMSGAEALGCLLLFHPEVYHFSMDQLDLVQAAANQVAVAVNNAELYRLIRDQAEDLGTMLRSQQVETSRSKAILEAVADGVIVTDANRIITLFNQSAEKILGLERAAVLGKSLEHFSGLFGRATHQWMQTIVTWSQDTRAYRSGDTYAEQLTLEDARVIAVRLAPVILRSDFLGTVSIFQDVTHQVEVDRLKSEFVATVSHELRTPMTSIKGYVEILLMGAAGQLSEQQNNFLQVVKSNTERLTVLVNDLLDVSQIESGKVTLSLQPVNMDDLLDNAIADLQRRISGDAKKVVLGKKAPPNLPRSLADPDRIRRVIDNLLDNAFQYNLPDGSITVSLSLNEEDGVIQVDVKDSGVGIPFEDQEQVFERFYRGESTLNLGVAGTGLGLSIVRNLVEMHGGRIWLTSSGKAGQGSTFSFTLPVYKPEG